ncbi:hypothetical protein [Flammeovirga agarivorans]|uniref:Uncharacterized protein n=1 Tax=Flammeovirga agarivorans TaxID=2726742 RepID=A0A7X8XXC7_9BACT|nr:hypothetical protein [Flammeovirga agarivorans]NLR93106.1 hypothetical protein [Flammeovirga agarivorans]
MSDKKATFFEGFKDPFDMINKLRIVFYGMASISVPFALVWYLQNKEAGNIDPFLPAFGNTVIGGVTAVILLVAIAVYSKYNKQLKEIRKEPSLPYRLSLLLRAQFYKFIPLAISPIVVAILYRLTLEPLLFGVYILSMVLFAMSNPSVHNVISDLRLNKNDKEVMLNNIPFDQTDMKL